MRPALAAAANGKRRRRWAASDPIRSAFMTCWAMSGSGPAIVGTRAMQERRTMAVPGQPEIVTSESTGAALGSVLRGNSGPPVAAGSDQKIGATVSGSAWPGRSSETGALRLEPPGGHGRRRSLRLPSVSYALRNQIYRRKRTVTYKTARSALPFGPHSTIFCSPSAITKSIAFDLHQSMLICSLCAPGLAEMLTSAPLETCATLSPSRITL